MRGDCCSCVCGNGIPSCHYSYSSSVFAVPNAYNEPILSFAPGSSERTSLQKVGKMAVLALFILTLVTFLFSDS